MKMIKKSIIVLVLIFLYAGTVMAASDFYIKAEPLTAEQAKIIAQVVSNSQTKVTDSPTYLKILLSLNRIIDGTDVVAEKEKAEAKIPEMKIEK